MSNESKAVSTFDQFNISPLILKALKDIGYTKPTPIQLEAIPAGLTKRDIIGCAQTGTGKTMAFLIPILNQLSKNPRKGALVLVPTRELAAQVEEELKKLTKQLKEITAAIIIGGVAMPPQIKALAKSPRVIIATPGRLADHLRRGSLSLRAVEILVMDEADRMLDMGFAQQISEIMRFVPGARQTFLFSATIPPNIERLASKYMRSPVRVSVGVAEKPVEKIVQKSMEVSAGSKKEILKNELKQRDGTVLVFTRTKHRADNLCKFLASAGYETGRIHGGRSQAQRTKTLECFKRGQFKILVATDLVSRGIDVAGISHVINFDLPMSPEDYIHRIGRTARAGAQGQALSFITPEESDQWKRISHHIKQ